MIAQAIVRADENFLHKKWKPSKFKKVSQKSSYERLEWFMGYNKIGIKIRYIKNKLKDIIIRSFIMFHLNPIVYKKDVFILGSAPDLNLVYSKDKMLVTYGGSASNAKIKSSYTKMTIVDNELIDESIAYSKPQEVLLLKTST